MSRLIPVIVTHTSRTYMYNFKKIFYNIHVLCIIPFLTWLHNQERATILGDFFAFVAVGFLLPFLISFLFSLVVLTRTTFYSVQQRRIPCGRSSSSMCPSTPPPHALLVNHFYIETYLSTTTQRIYHGAKLLLFLLLGRRRKGGPYSRKVWRGTSTSSTTWCP